MDGPWLGYECAIEEQCSEAVPGVQVSSFSPHHPVLCRDSTVSHLEPSLTANTIQCFPIKPEPPTVKAEGISIYSKDVSEKPMKFL